MIINWGDAPFKAFITVTYPSGTCSVSLGSKSFSHSGGGTYTFVVNKRGTWTITGTDGNGVSTSSSATVNLMNEAKSVTLSYSLYIVNGNVVHSACGGLAALALRTNQYENGPTPTVSYPSGSVRIFGTHGDSYGAGVVYTKNKIDLTGYKTLTVKGTMVRDINNSGYNISGVLSSTPTTSSCSFAASQRTGGDYNGTSFTLNYSINVSSLNSAYHLCLSRYYREVTVNITSMVLTS